MELGGPAGVWAGGLGPGSPGRGGVPHSGDEVGGPYGGELRRKAAKLMCIRRGARLLLYSGCLDSSGEGPRQVTASGAVLTAGPGTREDPEQTPGTSRRQEAP